MKLSDDVKRKLGYIIREKRKIKFKEFSLEKGNTGLDNPFAKHSFIENNSICHYNTYIKLERDIIKDDQVYYKLLEKLSLSYSVSDIEHDNNMTLLLSIGSDVLYALEYIDDEKLTSLLEQLEQSKLDNDCIASIYLELIQFNYDLQHIKEIKIDRIDYIITFVDFFEGIYKPLAQQLIAIYLLNVQNFSEAKKFLNSANKNYQYFGINEYITIPNMLSYLMIFRDYHKIYELCNKIIPFYIKNNNYKRLVQIYNCLSDYYSKFLQIDCSQHYFNEIEKIFENNKDFTRYNFVLYYNWGFRCFNLFILEEALRTLKKSLELCTTNVHKSKIYMTLIITMILNKSKQAEVIEMIKQSESYIEFAFSLDQEILRYLKYKYDSPNYYRKFATEKLIPLLQNNPFYKNYLLFVYKDLYNLI